MDGSTLFTLMRSYGWTADEIAALTATELFIAVTALLGDR